MRLICVNNKFDAKKSGHTCIPIKSIILLVLCLVAKISVICVTYPSKQPVYYVIFIAISKKDNFIK